MAASDLADQAPRQAFPANFACFQTPGAIKILDTMRIPGARRRRKTGKTNLSLGAKTFGRNESHFFSHGRLISGGIGVPGGAGTLSTPAHTAVTFGAANASIEVP